MFGRNKDKGPGLKFLLDDYLVKKEALDSAHKRQLEADAAFDVLKAAMEDNTAIIVGKEVWVKYIDPYRTEKLLERNRYRYSYREMTDEEKRQFNEQCRVLCIFKLVDL